MVRSRSFVSFMSMVAVLGGGAVLVAACVVPSPSSSSLCCCVTGANNIRECSPVSGPSECLDGSVEACTSIGLGGNGPGAQAAPSDDDTR